MYQLMAVYAGSVDWVNKGFITDEQLQAVKVNQSQVNCHKIKTLLNEMMLNRLGVKKKKKKVG